MTEADRRTVTVMRIIVRDNVREKHEDKTAEQWEIAIDVRKEKAKN